jgi:hypothetical protein
LPALTVLGLLAGCGGSATERQAVSGTVTFKGSPLDQGTIQFIPLAPTKGTFSGERIENGRYTIARAKGLLPGLYRVQISSGVPHSKAEEAAPGESGPPAVERIPPEFSGEKSRLKAEVKADGPNTFDFTIP